MSDIYPIEEVTETIRRQRDKGLRAGNDYFGCKWPLERGSDLRTFFNTKIREISSPETDQVLLENSSSCTFIQHPLQNFEYNSKPQSQKIPNPNHRKFPVKGYPNPRLAPSLFRQSKKNWEREN